MSFAWLPRTKRRGPRKKAGSRGAICALDGRTTEGKQPIRRTARALRVAAALLVCTGSTACLSNGYAVKSQELQRLASLPPDMRGNSVRVVQDIGPRRAAPVRPSFAPPALVAAPPAPAPPPSPSSVGVHVQVGVGGPTRRRGAAPPITPAPVAGAATGRRVTTAAPAGPSSFAPASGAAAGSAAPQTAAGRARLAPVASSAGPSSTAPKPNVSAARPATTAPASGSKVSRNSGSKDIKDLKTLGVLAVATAAVAAVGLTATEGSRYDGWISLAPQQPLHLDLGDLGVQTVALDQLTPSLAEQAESATVNDDEGWGFYRLGRAPLDRRGFAFRFELGTSSRTLQGVAAEGFTSQIQLGYFPWRHVGFLGSALLGFGQDAAGRSFFANQLGVEAQAFLPALSVFHLGGFSSLGSRGISAEGAAGTSQSVLNLGALLEIELTTRLALTARAGWAFANRQAEGLGSRGFSATAGLAIY